MTLVGEIGLWITYSIWGVFAVVIVFILYILPLYRWVCKEGRKLFGYDRPDHK